MALAKTRLRAGERQLEIVRAVLALAAGNSPDAITTQAIAEHMGLTQGAVFRHFPTREAIWLAVVDWLEESLSEAIAAAIAEIYDPVERLQRTFEAHIAFIVQYPSAPRLMFNELQKPADSLVKQRVCSLLQHYRTRLIALLTQAKAQNQVTADLDEAAAATLFIGAIQGLVMQTLLAGDPAHLQPVAGRLLPLYLRGIGVRQP
ncbi:MAG TPA: TetR/AcrR family transcriptional regulator [Candidatus Competibacteraceae bacterium]|nr:TetR/AcrR family transcriptional regulator [Candidatus Competibacteraceae bacterium]HRZ05036.1 TetR/AcrR family transcriptional regulator [Candidatus Competibacteraceae bacterium]HSA45677.1 TetR/AcrR family transcriptional regulator [Candidatus Competibacteraceae bacterium]